MALFSLIAVLLIEHIRPLPYHILVHEPVSWLATRLERLFNAGERKHGVIAWLLLVLGLILLVAGMYSLLQAISPLLAWLLNVLILYMTMGFMRFGHDYSDIQLALRMDDLPQARQLLADWLGQPADHLSPAEVAQRSIEAALIAAHRHVFGVLICFVLLPGPCGAVLYRLSGFLAETWGRRSEADAGHFGNFARQAFAAIDWVPSRVTAAGFAFVGNFEDAIFCWRTQAGLWPENPQGPGIGIVLASGAGALGLRLECGSVNDSETLSRCTVLGTGEAANVDFMQSTAGLLWRALVLWLLLLLLLGVASLVGQ